MTTVLRRWPQQTAATEPLPVSTRVTVYVIWLLVLLSVQPWSASSQALQGNVSDSGSTGKGILIAVCFFVALLLAPRGLRIRMPAPWVFYLAYLATAVVGSLLLIDPSSSILRIVRIVVALSVPLLLWDILRRDPLLLLKAHMAGYAFISSTVVLGTLLRPSKAWEYGRSFAAGGRLQGALLPMLPPRVGEIGAVLVGLTVITWSYKRMPAWLAVPAVSVGAGLIFLSRTRTAAVALVVAIIIATLITIKGKGSRRILAGLLCIAAISVPFIPAITAWVVRGQSAERLTSLSGRTIAWEYILNAPLKLQTMVFGHGLGNKKVLLTRGQGDVNTVPIDNSWLSVYWESGLAGVALVLAAVLAASYLVLRSPRSYVRAATMFLLVYLGISSFSETGLSDLSTQTVTFMVVAMTADLDRWRVRFGEVFDRRRASTTS